MYEEAWLGAAAMGAAVLAFYSTLAEPRRLVVNRFEIRSPGLPEGFDGKTIVQFSDTHLLHHHSMERFERLVDRINDLGGDIVAFTGDLFDSGTRATERDPTAIPLLARIRAPLGKFAVYGNHDFGYERRKRMSGDILTAGGFDVLVNETRRVVLPGGEAITVSGLDDRVLGRPDPRRALGGLAADGFHLLLAHEPDVADELTAYPVDLQLSGHSHGGQVSLPGIGAIIRTDHGRKYVRGLHELKGRHPERAGRPYLLYVNRGIGTTRLHVRFGSVPELAVFTLRRSVDGAR